MDRAVKQLFTSHIDTSHILAYSCTPARPHA
jgi:hypothetical protein